MEKKIRWGIIGAGGIAKRRTIPAVLETNNAQVIALMDTDANVLNQLSQEYNIENIYQSEDELLENPEIDAVYIASPVLFHKKQVEKVFKSGKHILIEKPLGLDLAEASYIESIYKDVPVKVSPAMVMRFHDGHRKVKDLISRGVLGQIVSCRAQLTCWFPDMENNWRQDASESGGGALMDMGIHCIDLLCYLLEDEVSRVGGLISTKVFKYEVDDSASVLLEMRGGTTCYVDSYFNIPDNAAPCMLEIYGTKGSIIATGTIGQDGGGTIKVTLSDQSSGYESSQMREQTQSDNYELDFEKHNIYTKQIESFSKAILDDTIPEVLLSEGVYTQNIIETLYKAANQGRFLSIE